MILSAVLFTGLSNGINFILPVTLAASWFPAQETATAIGVTWSAVSLGEATAALVYPMCLPYRNATQIENNSHDIRLIFMSTKGTSALILTISALFFVFMLKNQPPTPPGAAQANILTLLKADKNERASHEVDTSFLKLVLNLLVNRQFLLLASANSLGLSALILAKVLAPSLISMTFPEVTYREIGWIRIAGTLASIIAGLAVGYYLDRLKKFKEFAMAIVVRMLLVTGGIYFGHLCKYFPVLIVLYPALAALRICSNVIFTEFLTEVIYPFDNTILMSIYYFPSEVAAFIFGAVIRKIMDMHGATMAIIVPLIACFMQWCLVALVKPDYRRLSAEMVHETDTPSQRRSIIDESKPLLLKSG
uniref:feline leukemia virus subgroup C receptor-related protein 1-like n=1 Tax=Styela clava TaxID=7725 RepID=UPI00193A5187|nr:feline leukemia virus subgroup C receptor-related protein 1-like [Styela clava]